MHDHILNKVTAANEKRISIVADNIFLTVICHHLLPIMVQYDVVLKMQSKASEMGVVRILTTQLL